MSDDSAPIDPSSRHTWDWSGARRAFLVIAALAVVAGFLGLRSQRVVRSRCLDDYALARSAADTARVDGESFPQGRSRTYCRDFRMPPRRPGWPPN